MIEILLNVSWKLGLSFTDNEHITVAKTIKTASNCINKTFTAGIQTLNKTVKANMCIVHDSRLEMKL
jgi:hypothetical protein